MEHQKKRVLEIFSEYLENVNKVRPILAEFTSRYPITYDELGYEIVPRFPPHGSIPDKGIIRYDFHGIGCLVETESFKIDFDYDLFVIDSKRIYGVDGWFLYYYIEWNNLLKIKEQEFEQCIIQLLNDGELKKHDKPGRNMLYLREDFDELTAKNMFKTFD